MIRKSFPTALWIALSVGLLIAAVLPIKALMYHSPDDAFFYLKTAWNFAAGHGSTFDGFNPTNGYHPLWFLVLTCFYALGEVFGIATPETMYRVAFGAQWFMVIGSVYYAARAFGAAEKDRDVTSHAMLFGLLAYFLVFIRVVGSEAQVSVFIIAAYFFVKSREWQSGTPRFLLKSALLALLFLSRIDYITTLVPAMFMGDVVTSPRGERLRNAAFLAAVAGGTAVTYFFVNLTEFGHLLTVSASWKSEFPRFLLFSNIPFYVNECPVQFARAVISIGVCAGFAIRVFRGRKNAAPMDIFLGWLAVGAVVFMLQTMSFNAHKIREWYTSVPVFIALFIAMRYALRFRRISNVVTVPIAAAGLGFLVIAGMLTSKWDANYDFAKTLGERFGATEPVLIVDCAGIVGYFSGVPVVNGDGLVNSFDYLEAVRRGEIRQWLASRGVRYYASYSFVQPDSLHGNYLDRAVTGLGGMDFVFTPSQAVFRAPFSIDNIRFHSSGEWIVFTFDDSQSGEN